jgi:hypothetical protein
MAIVAEHVKKSHKVETGQVIVNFVKRTLRKVHARVSPLVFSCIR